MSAYNGMNLVAGETRRRRWLIVAVVLAIAAIVGAFFLGRSNAAHTVTNAAPSAGLPINNGQGGLRGTYGPTRLEEGLPVGYSHDQSGALQAGAVMSETLMDLVQARRAVPVSTWTGVYAGGDVRLDDASMQAIYNTNATSRPTGFPATGAVPGLSTTPSSVTAVLQLVPIGYKVNAISPGAADVEIWLAGQGWSRGESWANVVVYQDFRLQLAWTGGDWHLTGISWTKYGGPTGTSDPAQFKSMPGYQPWRSGTQITVLTGGN